MDYLSSGKRVTMTPEKKRLLHAIADAQERYPGLRLGQLIANALPAGKDIFYLEDNELAMLIYLTYRDIHPNVTE